MATGDLHNNLEKLRIELRNTSIPQDQTRLDELSNGNPVAFLASLHHILLDESVSVARFLLQRGYRLSHLADRNFLEGALRVIRNEFSYRPTLTVDQFLSKNFAERKLIFLCDVLKLCKRKADELEREQRDTLKRGLVASTTHAKTTSTSVSSSESSSSSGNPSERESEANKAASTSKKSPLKRTSAVSSQSNFHRGKASPHHQLRQALVPSTTPNGLTPTTRNKVVGTTIGSLPSRRSPMLFENTNYLSDHSDGSSAGVATGGATVVTTKMGNISGDAPNSEGSPSLRNRNQVNYKPSPFESSRGKEKRPLSLQTSNLGGVGGQDESRSPTSSGPVSPVSITSAASAPPVFRQLPVRAKPEMASQVRHHYHQQHAFSAQQSSELDISLHSHAFHRGMECWVTSPSANADRNKKKDGIAVHINNGHSSPRVHGHSGSPMQRVPGSISNVTPGTSRKSSSSGYGKPVAAATAAPGSPMYNQILLQHHLHNHQQPQPQIISSNSSVSSSQNQSQSVQSNESDSDDKDFHSLADSQTHQRSRKHHRKPNGQNGSLYSTRSQHWSKTQQVGRSSNYTKTSAKNSSALQENQITDENINNHPHQDQQSGGIDLMEQFSKMVSVLDHLSSIPARMDQMEKKMMSALKVMDKRIDVLDSKLQDVNKTPKLVLQQTKNMESESLNPQASQKASVNQSPHVLDGTRQDVQLIGDFLKGIEERFKETETVLAESEN